ncbi:hypothetical protein P186_1961 [Pyrobaculum ferrireducens]|uniref:Uncharacterized protein n=2 Tax=Pyrobaculum ferrireducens TaxID=1104324 RepID=G7VI03_9CREN|nr:hypothetical protein P186_1961 [Pyrobaculum ferrireducens]
MLELLKDRSILRYHYPEIVSSIVKNLVENRLVKLPGDVDLYLAQSRYVVEFLRRYGVPWENIILLHEPLEEEFIKSALDANLPAKKENAVAWNRRKSNTVGYKLAKLLRDRFKVYELFNVGKEKMVDILSRTKVFIDIGWHPGRDRPPREAVAMWNVPLVNNHGGLYYYEDYPVPHKYKIDCYDICNKVSYKELVDRVIDFVENYDAHIKVFEDFRRYIVEEPELFIKDVGMLVKRLGV